LESLALFRATNSLPRKWANKVSKNDETRKVEYVYNF